MNNHSPLVSLVGAGPGDPELLTRRGASRLGAADLVLYDALVDPALLELAPRARRWFVGKRAGKRAMQQETIGKLMVRAARRGQRVVRLKCGDPCVLGRGGEEALVLAEAGVPYEIVPGVSSALAAPALAGIPVTHRGLSSGFVVITGHSAASTDPLLDGLAPGRYTVVVLMGLRRRRAIAQRLIERGWPADTEMAVLTSASHADATRWLGTLGAVALGLCDADESRPGTLVIGDVVGLARSIGGAEVPLQATKQAQGGSR
ncbi:MAG: uroporphyrinogen-III C-methyltransferase [Myxococcales bacterium]|nr:uroporphyrinogen-III C-methyltransferase [Myxococcales bacterium]